MGFSAETKTQERLVLCVNFKVRVVNLHGVASEAYGREAWPFAFSYRGAYPLPFKVA